MIKCDIKIGYKVKAKFRKYGVHTIIGVVTEICNDEHALIGTWVSIKVTGGDTADNQVKWMIANRVGVLVPFSDVVEVLQ